MEAALPPFPNRIEITTFGAAFLRELPVELHDLHHQNTSDDRQATSIARTPLPRRGKGLDFRLFALQTQQLVQKSLNRTRGSSGDLSTTDGLRKLQMSHQQWVSEQRLVRHKLADAQSRLEQGKFSEYDWRTQSQTLKRERLEILGEWEEGSESRSKRRQSRIKRMMQRNYPRTSHASRHL